MDDKKPDFWDFSEEGVLFADTLPEDMFLALRPIGGTFLSRLCRALPFNLLAGPRKARLSKLFNFSGQRPKDS
jgi:hypothetical protein